MSDLSNIKTEKTEPPIPPIAHPIKQEPQQAHVRLDESATQVTDDDPVVKELDVYLARTLSNKLYVLQFPIRPHERTYDEAKITNARIKPKQSRVELELELNTTSDNYSRVKGEQFAINVDGGLGKFSTKQADLNQRGKYFRSNIMDKLVLTSTNACLGQMNRLYHLGVLKNDALHLTPIQGIVQMKPSFEYFDLAEKRFKDSSGGNQEEGGAYSTEEEPDSEIESKPELVTLKYGAPGQSGQTAGVDEPNWINVEFVREDSGLKNSLECKHTDVRLKIELSNDELIRKSVDFNNLINEPKI